MNIHSENACAMRQKETVENRRKTNESSKRIYVSKPVLFLYVSGDLHGNQAGSNYLCDHV